MSAVSSNLSEQDNRKRNSNVGDLPLQEDVLAYVLLKCFDSAAK